MNNTRPTRILSRSIATTIPILRPFGDDDIIDDGPGANWDDLESQIGKDPSELGKTTSNEPEKKEPEVIKETDKNKDEKVDAAITPNPEDDSSKVSKKEDEEDPELAKLTPPPNSNPQQVKHWQALKSVTKARTQERDAAKQDLARVQGELEELRKTGVNDPAKAQELETLKAENEKLRKAAMIVDVEESEEFKQTYHEPVNKARETLKETLTRYKMPAAQLEAALAQGDNWPNWEKAKALLKDFEWEEIQEARRAVRLAERAKEKAVTDLRGPEREKFLTERQTRTQEEEKSYWTSTGAKANELLHSDEGKHMLPEEIPQNATEDQKAAITKRNDLLKTRNAEVSNLLGRAIKGRDPEATATLAFRAANSVWLSDQLKEAQTKLADAEKRLAEAETKLGKSRKIQTDVTRAPIPPKKTDADEYEDISAEEAMDRAREAATRS